MTVDGRLAVWDSDVNMQTEDQIRARSRCMSFTISL
jgi:hypothetical protein